MGEMFDPESSVSKLAIQKEVPKDQWNIGTRLAHRIEELGVKDYFVVPGDFNLTLLDQLLKNSNIRMVGCCNELNAGYAGDGYARSSPSGVAVVVVTYMVGGLSLLNAIAGAYSEGLKVVVVSACPPVGKSDPDTIIHHSVGTQDQDHALRIFREVTTASVRLDGKEDPAELLDKTLIKCVENSLPVYIEIPCGSAEVPCKSPKPLVAENQLISQPGSINAALGAVNSVWKHVKRPLMIVGPHVRRQISQELMVALIEKLGCAVLCQPDAKSQVPESHSQFAGTFWPVEPGSNSKIWTSDLWIILGGRWTDLHTPGGVFDRKKEAHRMLYLDTDQVKTPDGRQIKDIALTHLVEAIVQSDIPRNPATVSRYSKPNGAYLSQRPQTASQVTLAGVLDGVQKILKTNGTLIADAGDCWFTAQEIKLPPGADFQKQMVYSAIGWSLPAALGCQLARPDGRAVLMVGDGAFQMTAAELSTMIRMKANAIVLIFNNMGYRTETAIHDGPYNYLSSWNYAQFASSMCNHFHTEDGGNKYLTGADKESLANPSMFAMRIKTHGDLMVGLDRAEREPHKLALLECCIHPDDTSSVLQTFGRSFGQG
ncbi:hypothetical protein ASPWEDRAFT_49762 [Aspergillus wentii DTO 134E9]|uniref:Pyruvate decarboxylase n=1 Tax=Aspergillus wentii DTO 134E9 TaxID=1073089 RepID=A0A1L9RYF6_ASPWE|nr:uncharacterized protein ASPWEDRAFT_49762 [Aspergillus wentii DTO 134E9]OJJ39914.1 hypothetical protein ASPWEDRAFT_49762 [Aspergillus wentii DTO 134E9]